MTNTTNNPYSKENLRFKNWSLIDGSQTEQSLNLEADVVIVGTGAGGGISAEILSKAGLKVIMVEEGPLRHSEHFNMLEKEAYPDLYQESAARKTADKAISIMQGRAVGGSTTVNWTSSFRTPNQTLNHWQKEHNVQGLSTEQMIPWFEWVEKRLNIHTWPVPPNPNNQMLQDGLTALGWESKIIPRNVNGCANLGYCGMGCPINAKQSMLVSTIPTALDHQATLISRVRVEKLIISDDKVSGVELRFINVQGQLRNLNGGKITAKHVILSAGAIGTPAIMLRSQTPDPYNLVGKRTFIHPVNLTAAIYDQVIDPFSGAPQSVYSDQFLWPDAQQMGFKLEVPPMHPVLTSTMINGFGKEHSQVFSELPKTNATLALLRDGFHEQSQGGEVKLDDNLYPILDYPITDLLWKGFKKSYQVMMEVQFAAGAKKVIPMHRDAVFVDSWKKAQQMLEQLPLKKLRAKILTAHLMGGAPLGSDAKSSVINNDQHHHQLEGLSIIDGSVFPTSLGVNPQLTIYAMSARAATALSAKLKK